MRQIFKNYLKTFLKNWIQTLGTILFILMMVTIVIGMLASPLQISTIINQYKNKNNDYTTFLDPRKNQMSDDFAYQYVYKDTAFEGKGYDGKDTVVVPINANPNFKILSKGYKEVLAQLEKNADSRSTDQERQTLVADHINTAATLYKQGGLISLKTDDSLKIQEGEGYNPANPNLALVMDNLADLMLEDLSVAVDQGYGKTVIEKQVLARSALKLGALFQNNKLEFNTDIIKEMMAGGSGNLDRVTKEGIANPITREVYKGVLIKIFIGPEFESALSKVSNSYWTFSTFEVFSPEMYRLLSTPSYSYDFNAYIFNQFALNTADPEKTAVWNEKDEYRYKVQSEQVMHYSTRTSTSLFPQLSVDLKTINDEDDFNQLQLEKGDRPNKLLNLKHKTTQQEMYETVNDLASGKKPLQIVLNSGYAVPNDKTVGNTFDFPSSVASNTILLPAIQTIDSKFTNELEFKVTGEGSKFDDLVPGQTFVPFLEDIKTYANAYVDNTTFYVIRNARWNNTLVNERSFTGKYMIKNMWSKSDDVDHELAFYRGDGSERTQVGVFHTGALRGFETSQANKQLNRLQVIVNVFLILGVVVLLLSFVFINFIIKKELNETRKQIGIFKSFGYKISELSWIFAVKTFITIFVGILVGLACSIPLQLYSVSVYLDQIMFNYAHIYTGALFLVILIVIIPAIFLLTSYISTLVYLKEPTLSLLSNGAKISKVNIKPSPLVRYLDKHNKGFTYRLQRAFVRRSIGKFTVVQILFAVASLSYTLIFGAQTLLYAMVNQGFSALNPKTDHEFRWVNKDEINIPLQNDRFTVPDLARYKDQNFEYAQYSNKDGEGIGEALRKDTKTSDARYRISYVIDSYANEFNSNRDHALDLMLPKDLYMQKYATGFPSVPGFDSMLEGTDLFKFLLPDYYLNWVFTFKIDQLDQKIVDEVANSTKFNFSHVQDYVEKHPDARLSLNPSDLMDPQKRAEMIKEFSHTIFGIKPLDAQGRKNNLFLADITKIIVLQLAEQNFASQIDDWLTTNGTKIGDLPNGDPKYSVDDVNKAIAAAKESSIAQAFDPNNIDYWGILDNPLIDFDKIQKELKDAKNKKDDKDVDDDSKKASKSKKVGAGLSLSKMPEGTITLIMSALILGVNDLEDINKNSVITMNQLFYNKDTEFLSYSLLTNIDESESKKQKIDARGDNVINLRLFDSKSDQFGTYTNLLTHNGVSDDTYKKLGDEVQNDDYGVYGVIPYGLARTYNLKVGSTFKLVTNTVRKEEIIIHVTGINESVSFQLGTGWPIDVDYTRFREKFFDEELNQLYEDPKDPNYLPMFNALFSQEQLLAGHINVKDVPGSINSMKFMGLNLSMAIDNDASVFGSVFNGLIDLQKIFNIKVDPNFLMPTNPNIAQTSASTFVAPYNILRSGADNIINRINNILILFMVLEALLLLIILVVVMNIVVEEAAQIILTLRALGYKPLEINWVVMGSYVTGAIISFIIAYILSIVIWVVFLDIVGRKTHIYVFMKYSWEAPVITFLVVGAILFIGWLAADRRVNKTPLTRITSFG